jgi:glycerol-3-phosphate dehydrogenase (NAD(P)+)
MTIHSHRVAVIGAGSWGTALAIVAARCRMDVRLWARDRAIASGIRANRRNPHYLSEFELPGGITATSSLAEALTDAGFVIVAVPSHAMRHTFQEMLGSLGQTAILINAAKGIENGTLMRMSEVVESVVGGARSIRYVVLSGPSFAREVAGGVPTAIVAASREPDERDTVQRQFSHSTFRVYTNDDVVGVELGGSVKNVIAIAAGVVQGLGLGSNSVAAIVTRGLAEMTRLAVAAGSRAETMSGLAGLGDLVLTCTGDLSRNRYVGIELGRGKKLVEIVSGMREIAEGVNTTRAVYDLGRKLNVSMPITASVNALLSQDRSALEAAYDLMERPLRAE